MKRIFFYMLMCLISFRLIAANEEELAEIKFDKEIHDFGTFSESAPKVTCTFEFTNVGNRPLIIHQAIASCGCTVPEYPKHPIQPGEKGTIKVTYNGAGKFPGMFKKSITIRTNGKTELTRLYIKGNMVPADEEADKKEEETKQ